jgi:hypothetical protein
MGPPTENNFSPGSDRIALQMYLIHVDSNIQFAGATSVRKNAEGLIGLSLFLFAETMGLGKGKRGAYSAYGAFSAHKFAKTVGVGRAKGGLMALIALLALKFGKGD